MNSRSSLVSEFAPEKTVISCPLWRKHCRRGVTLVEVMVSMGILGIVAAGLAGSFIQSRRVTESSVIHAAATSLVYGIIEQMKSSDYTTLIPATETDDDQASKDAFPLGSPKSPPYVRVRLNQDQVTWLRVKYSQVSELGVASPQAPLSTPATTVTAASLDVPENTIGPMLLSSLAGATSQSLTLKLWIWIDEIPNVDDDVGQVKRITMVYTYTVSDGRSNRTIRDREVFLRTRYDQ